MNLKIANYTFSLLAMMLFATFTVYDAAIGAHWIEIALGVLLTGTFGVSAYIDVKEIKEANGHRA